MMYNTVKISYSYQSFAFPIRFYSDAIKAIKALTLYPSLHILEITNNLFHVTRSQSSSERERQMSVNGRGSLLFLFPISPFFHAALPNHTRFLKKTGFEENCSTPTKITALKKRGFETNKPSIVKMLKFLKATKIHIHERFTLIDREKIADKPHVLGGLYF